MPVEVNGWLPPHAHHEIILDGTQLNDLSGWVQSVLNYWHGQNPPQGNFDARGVQELVKILRPSITAPVLLPFAKNEQEFKHLTEQQIGILDFLASHRRVAISGCAGSGKTLLALEKARRLHEQGFNVLLTCYNRGLVQFLRQRLGSKQNLHVYTFHGSYSSSLSNQNEVDSIQINYSKKRKDYDKYNFREEFDNNYDIELEEGYKQEINDEYHDLILEGEEYTESTFRASEGWFYSDEDYDSYESFVRWNG